MESLKTTTSANYSHILLLEKQHVGSGSCHKDLLLPGKTSQTPSSNFRCDAAANLEIEKRAMLEYMVEDDEQMAPEELSRVEEVDISDTSSEWIDPATSTSIDNITSASITTSTSESIDTYFGHRSIPLEIPESSSCPLDIADSTQKSIDASSCYPNQDVEKEITMEDFLELEEFLELEDGEQLGDLDSSIEVTMDDFIELEEWLESEQKLDDERNTMRKDMETSSKTSIDRYRPDEIDRHPPDSIDRHPPECIDRHTSFDELPGCTVKLEPIEVRMHKSKTSYLAVPEHLRPICAEEAAGICKRMKRIHDPVKIVIPCTVVEDKSPIPPDRGVHLNSCNGVFNDHQHIVAFQREMRCRTEDDKGLREEASIDTVQKTSIDNITPPPIDIYQIPPIDIINLSLIDTTTGSSIDTRRESEQNEYEVCGNINDGDTTTRSEKSGER